MGRLGHLATLAVAALVAVLAGTVAGAASERVPTGGTFRIGHHRDVDAIDPALASPFVGEAPVDAWSVSCLHLLNYADSSRVRIVPEAAAAYPKVSGDQRTFTFTIRRGLRFSNGERVTARTFAATINRTLKVGRGPAELMSDIVGAQAVREGKASAATGVKVRGTKLIVTTVRPAPLLPLLTTTSGYCAVPVGLPPDPEGVAAPLPAAGPYYIASWVRGRRLVLARNRFYRGRRPRRVDRFVITYNLPQDATVPAIRRGALDAGDLPGEGRGRAVRELVRRYGVNRSQFFVKPTPFVLFLVFNHRRRLFSTARARRAVNYAIDRRALVRASARDAGPYWASPTDQWLTPSMPGYRAARIFPFRASPKKARALLGRGRQRTGFLYTRDNEPYLSWAQIVQRNLRAVGIRVTVKAFPRDVLFEKTATPGERWDIAFGGGFGPDLPDPASVIKLLFDSPPVPATYRRQIRTADRLAPAARYRAYGRLDVRIARDVAPTVPFATINLHTFVSKRVGCTIFRPELDLAAVCLKR